MRITSNFSRFASRRSLANLSMAQKQIAPTTMIVKTDTRTKTMAIPCIVDLHCFEFTCKASFPLCLRQIDPVVEELARAPGEASPALGPFCGRRRGGIGNFFNRLCGQLRRTRGGRPLSRHGFHPYSESPLDQAADGFGAAGSIGCGPGFA